MRVPFDPHTAHSANILCHALPHIHAHTQKQHIYGERTTRTLSDESVYRENFREHIFHTHTHTGKTGAKLVAVHTAVSQASRGVARMCVSVYTTRARALAQRESATVVRDAKEPGHS